MTSVNIEDNKEENKKNIEENNKNCSELASKIIIIMSILGLVSNVYFFQKI